MTISLLLMSAFFWFAGFLSMKGLFSLGDDPTLEMNKVIIPPKWLYYLCGAPKSKNYTSGSMTIGAIRVQLVGIAFVIFSIVLGIWPSQNNLIIGLVASVLLPYLIAYWVSKHSRPLHPKKKK